MFSDTLTNIVLEKKSPLCLGLDPYYSRIPEHLKKNASPEEAILKFLVPIIDACSEHIVCVKPQLAFFEIFGSAGFAAFEKVCMFAKARGLLVIVDGKRGDIGSTAEAYAEAYLGKNRPYDALTVNPYLGSDGILPFVKKCVENEKGLFILTKTSNPSAGEFQDLPVGDELVHENIAHAVARWGMDDTGLSGFSSIGAVVGATYPDEMEILRREMPSQIFLVPGYGVQGATAEDISGAFYKGGTGAIINSSRGILFAFEDYENPEKFAEHSQKAAQEAQEELWAVTQ
ncbi:MAG: orotidine-5'-phosphate decarboxylase [Candidatus Peregrinibacteria bacterium]